MQSDPHEGLWLAMATAAPIVALAFAVVVQSSFERARDIFELPHTPRWLRLTGLTFAGILLAISLWLVDRCGYVLLNSFRSLRLHEDAVSPRGDEFVLYRGIGLLFVALLGNGLLTLLPLAYRGRATTPPVDQAGTGAPPLSAASGGEHR